MDGKLKPEIWIPRTRESSFEYWNVFERKQSNIHQSTNHAPSRSSSKISTDRKSLRAVFDLKGTKICPLRGKRQGIQSNKWHIRISVNSKRHTSLQLKKKTFPSSRNAEINKTQTVINLERQQPLWSATSKCSWNKTSESFKRHQSPKAKRMDRKFMITAEPRQPW